MGKERLSRFLIILGVSFFVALTGLVSARWLEKKKQAGESVSLPTEELEKKINQWGEDVLGKAIEILPLDEEIKQKLSNLESPVVGDDRQDETQVLGETEAEKTETVNESQKLEIITQEIIETIKELPEEQAKKIKKEIFGDFCQEILEE